MMENRTANVQRTLEYKTLRRSDPESLKKTWTEKLHLEEQPSLRWEECDCSTLSGASGASVPDTVYFGAPYT
jgi:hypothetical protein